MTLSEFIIEMNKSVDKFKKDWEDGAKIDSDMYPNELSEGDWYDQILAYMECQ